MQAVLCFFRDYVAWKFLDWVFSRNNISTRCKAFLVRCFYGNKIRIETAKDTNYLSQEERFISAVQDASETIKLKPTNATKEIIASSYLEDFAIDIEHVMNSPGH